MTSLNLADNNIGQLVMSNGWQFDEDADEYWKEVEGEELVEKQLPAGEQLAIESPVGVIAIVNAIKDMRALTKLIFGGDQWYNGQKLTTPKPATLEVGMVEADFSNKGLQASGAIIVAAWLSQKDMSALTSLDISANNIGAYFDGHQMDNIEADGSWFVFLNNAIYLICLLVYILIGPKVIADAISDNGALTSLNMPKNDIKGAEAGKALVDALAGNTVLKELELSGEQFYMDIGFVKAFIPGLSDNGTMTSLSFASNRFGVQGAKIIAAVLLKCT
jgi:hypothetical protein